jgi:hypothetical protein
MHTSRCTAIGIVWAMGISLAWAQGGFGGPGRYEILNLQSGKVIDLDRNDQTTVIQFQSRGTDNQQWDFQPAGEGFFYILNAMNGRALEVTGGNSSPLVGRPPNRAASQQWRIEAGKDGNALIVSRLGKTIDVPDGSNRDGLKLQIYDLNGDSNQRFILRRVGGSGGPRGGPPIVVDRPGPRGGGGPDRWGRIYDERDGWRLERDGVCFYERPNFRGEALCLKLGDEFRNVPRDFGEVFSSVRFFGRVREVVVYERRDFRGERYRIRRDERDIQASRPAWMSTRMGSVQVF